MTSSRLTESPSRILVVKLSSLGDLFHALPAVARIQSHYRAPVDWVTQPQFVELVETFSPVDRVIPFPRHSFASDAKSFLQSLRQESYDLGIDFQGLMKSALILKTARCRLRLGPSRPREGTRLLYDEVGSVLPEGPHAIDEAMSICRHLGLEAGPVQYPMKVAKMDFDQASPRIGFIPASRWPAKNLSIFRWIDLGQKLQSKTGANLFLFGAPGDRDICDAIEKGITGINNRCGKTSIVEMCSALSSMDCVVSVDSGPMHAAVAVDTPVVSLFGTTDPKRTGPHGDAPVSILADPYKHHPNLPRLFKKNALAGTWDIPTEMITESVISLISG